MSQISQAEVEALENNEYLGDGLYVGTCPDVGQVWLYATDGMSVLNSVAMEPRVLSTFLDYLKRCEAIAITSQLPESSGAETRQE